MFKPDRFSSSQKIRLKRDPPVVISTLGYKATLPKDTGGYDPCTVSVASVSPEAIPISHEPKKKGLCPDLDPPHPHWVQTES